MTKKVVLMNLERGVYLESILELKYTPNWKKAFMFADETDAISVIKHLPTDSSMQYFCTRTFYKK
jgi:hypothetical protein